MRIAAKVLILSMVAGVLGSADATAPDLANAPAALSPTANPHDVSLNHWSHPDQLMSVRSASDGTATTRAHDGEENFWLLGGVACGLVLYQLRRKHRLLRPRSFVLRPDL